MLLQLAEQRKPRRIDISTFPQAEGQPASPPHFGRDPRVSRQALSSVPASRHGRQALQEAWKRGLEQLLTQWPLGGRLLSSWPKLPPPRLPGLWDSPSSLSSKSSDNSRPGTEKREADDRALYGGGSTRQGGCLDTPPTLPGGGEARTRERRMWT